MTKLKITIIDNCTAAIERIYDKFPWMKPKPESSINQKARYLMQKMHKDGHSIITMMIHVNALCGLSLKENEVAHAIGEMNLALPSTSKDKETPVP